MASLEKQYDQAQARLIDWACQLPGQTRQKFNDKVDKMNQQGVSRPAAQIGVLAETVVSSVANALADSATGKAVSSSFLKSALEILDDLPFDAKNKAVSQISKLINSATGIQGVIKDTANKMGLDAAKTIDKHPAYSSTEELRKLNERLYGNTTGQAAPLPQPPPFEDDFETGQDTFNRIDPIAIDLDGDGIETTNINNGVYFDLDANGFAESTAWVGNDDGLLVLDRNNNGKIDSGRELFGDQTLLNNGQLATSGYQALSALDSNLDGKIDLNDTQFANLKVLKGDGSLITLQEAGLKSINLSYSNTNSTDPNGNVQVKSGSYTKTDDTIGQVGEFNFNRNTTNSVATESLEVSEEVEILPDAEGYGNVYTLHQAMVRDTSGVLKTLIESFVNETDPALRHGIMNQILAKWSGCENISSTNMSRGYSAQKLAVLEKFIGHSFRNSDTSTVNSAAAPFLDNSYASLTNYVYAQLISQTHLKSLYDGIEFTFDEETLEIKGDLSAIATAIQDAITANSVSGKELLNEFTRSIYDLQIKNSVDYQAFYNTFASMGAEYKFILDTADKVLKYGTENADNIDGSPSSEAIYAGAGNDYVQARQGDDLIYGEAGNDTLVGCYGNDYLDGGEGDDLLQGLEDNDNLVGGLGNDVLQGGTGNDTYTFNSGDGQDVISDASGIDNIKFGTGITADSLITSTNGNDLIISITGTTDTITIQNYFGSTDNKIERIYFTDGTFVEKVENLILGTTSDDTITGNLNDNFYLTRDGNDIITDAAGNDTYWTGTGNDTITDELGDDIYYFNKGDGQDIITDNAGIDKIVFDKNLDLTDINFVRNVDNLEINLVGTTDKLTIQNWFLSDNNKIESLELANGYIIKKEDLESIDNIKWGTAENNTITGTTANELYIGFTGNDSITDSAGNDIYFYNKGDGNDTITDLAGTDKIKFQSGITQDQVDYYRTSNDLVIYLKDNSGSVTVKDWYTNVQNKIESIEFANNVILTPADIASIFEIYGTENNDTITGRSRSDIIYGLDGNDKVDAGSQNDFIDAGLGNDSLYGQDGNDTLIGGVGNDSLDGGSGNDTYIFNLGDGQDTISDYDSTTGNLDTIRFGEGISQNDLIFTASGNNLIVSNKNNTDKITIDYHFYNNSYKVENFEFADGTSLTHTDITSLLQTLGTDNNDIITGSSFGEKIYGYAGNDNINANSGNDTVDGGLGNDTIYGNDGDDYLVGNDGSDAINGDAGVDTIIGGIGNDSLDGGSGNDTYIFNLGDGQDSISDYDSTAGNLDTIRFGEGISQDDLMFTASGNKLIISNKNNADKITIDYHFYNNSYKVENFEFADGTIWTHTEIAGMLSILGTDGNDTLNGTSNSEKVYGYAGNDSIQGAGGNDTIYGGDGNDSIVVGNGNSILYGEAGNDTLSSSNGSDTLIGGIGNDSLTGYAGNDTYIFNLGDGQDTISDYDSTTGNLDTIKFGEGISQNDLIFTASGNNLIVSNKNNTDKITIDYHFYNNSYKVENFEFADGTSLTHTDITSLLQTLGTDNNDIITGSSFGEKVYGYAGNDNITANSGNDTVDGGLGNDTIYGNDGNDYLVGNDGSDTITGDTGNDTLIGGIGNDSLDGGTGNDTYIFNIGDGQDSISDYDSTAGNLDTIKFGEGISQNDLIFTASGNKLIISNKNNADKITIDYHFYNNSYKVENFEFADGTIWTHTDVTSLLQTVGTDNNDIITGSSFGEKVYGYAGNDNITANSGNDTVDGGLGNDTIYGNDGNDYLVGNDGFDNINGDAGADTLIGGIGNDSLNGGSGNDTYIFNLGDGQDTISDYDSTTGNLDTIRFGEGISQNDLMFTASGNNLIISNKNNADKITNDYHFYNNSYKVENFEFADGTSLTHTDVTSLLQTVGTDNNDIITGSSFGEKVYGYAGNDNITANSGNDTVDGGLGNDTIYGNDGNDYLVGNDGFDNINGDAGADTLIGGIGNDSLNGGSGNDTYIFNLGDGQDTISDYDSTTGNLDTIRFGEGISQNDLMFTASGNNLIVSNKNNTDKITIDYHFYNNSYKVENFEFADGTIWTHNQLKCGTIGNDALTGSSSDDKIFGSAGNDTITALQGNDFIQGGTGDDTYNFSSGDGLDVILDDLGTDLIKFDSTVNKNDIAVFKDASGQLYLDYNTTTGVDRITIKNQDNIANQIEQVKLNDNTYLSNADINQLLQDITTYAAANSISMSSIDDVKNNSELMNLVSTAWHA